jgi:hypothetical protein
VVGVLSDATFVRALCSCYEQCKLRVMNDRRGCAHVFGLHAVRAHVFVLCKAAAQGSCADSTARLQGRSCLPAGAAAARDVRYAAMIEL